VSVEFSIDVLDGTVALRIIIETVSSLATWSVAEAPEARASIGAVLA
jgi:hypothetical protein